MRLLQQNRLHFESATEAESALKIAGCGIDIFDSYFPPWKLLIHVLLCEAELPEHTTLTPLGFVVWVCLFVFFPLA